MDPQKEFVFEIWDSEKKRMSKPFRLLAQSIEWEDGGESTIASMVDFFGRAKERYMVRRSTGCRDKNGKVMYEFDIVRAHESTVGMVVWNNDLALFELLINLAGAESEEQGTMTIYSHQLDGNYIHREILGNMFQTPEKLEMEDALK